MVGRHYYVFIIAGTLLFWYYRYSVHGEKKGEIRNGLFLKSTLRGFRVIGRRNKQGAMRLNVSRISLVRSGLGDLVVNNINAAQHFYIMATPTDQCIFFTSIQLCKREHPILVFPREQSLCVLFREILWLPVMLLDRNIRNMMYGTNLMRKELIKRHHEIKIHILITSILNYSQHNFRLQ